jgi:hypothetical protein
VLGLRRGELVGLEHEKRQDDERAAAGDGWTDSGFVFTTGSGSRCRRTR